jgi:hypothetical protein
VVLVADLNTFIEKLKEGKPATLMHNYWPEHRRRSLSLQKHLDVRETSPPLPDSFPAPPKHGYVCHVSDGIPDAVYIGRPGRGNPGPYGNPFKLGPWESRGATLDQFRTYLWSNPDLLVLVPALRGKPLACFCRSKGEFGPPCHGDVYIALLEAKTDAEILERVKELVEDADRNS